MNPNTTVVKAPKPFSKESSLKTWVIIANVTFILSTVGLQILFSVNKISGIEYLILGTAGLALIPVFIAFIILGILTTVSPIAAIILNAIYLPRLYKGTTSKLLIRILLIIVNAIVFFYIIYVLWAIFDARI